MVQIRHEHGRAVTRHAESEGELAIPQAAVVRAKITNDTKVMQKCRVALARLGFQLLALLGVVPVRCGLLEQTGIEMRVRALAMGQGIGPARAYGNLDAFNGPKHQQAQFTIKDVQVQDINETAAGLEDMAGMVDLER